MPLQLSRLVGLVQPFPPHSPDEGGHHDPSTTSIPVGQLVICTLAGCRIQQSMEPSDPDAVPISASSSTRLSIQHPRLPESAGCSEKASASPSLSLSLHVHLGTRTRPSTPQQPPRRQQDCSFFQALPPLSNHRIFSWIQRQRRNGDAGVLQETILAIQKVYKNIPQKKAQSSTRPTSSQDQKVTDEADHGKELRRCVFILGGR